MGRLAYPRAPRGMAHPVPEDLPAPATLLIRGAWIGGALIVGLAILTVALLG